VKVTILVILALTFLNIKAWGQEEAGTTIIIPAFGDDYCRYVTKLESGQLTIDYINFRFSFVDSKQFVVASAKYAEFEQLKRSLSSSDYRLAIEKATQMLNIDYTSMAAHKALTNAYYALNDTIKAQKHETILRGLLRSVLLTGDGQSCQTAWVVVQVAEEYFVLETMNAQMNAQTLHLKHGLCDKLDVVLDGEEKSFYFEVGKVFEGYDKITNLIRR
jgi:hypothetical protein